MIAVDVRITGHVQGVFFRARTRERAEQLGVCGWVRNEADGSVTGHFEGDEDAVAGLVDWCHEGPSRAHVSTVRVTPSEVRGLDGFDVPDR